MTQDQLFPKTPVDFATEFLEHFQADVESAEKSVASAQAKLSAARLLRNDAEENLRRERIKAGVASPEEIALDMKRSAEAAGLGLSFQVNDEEPIVIAEPPAQVDPITGEVQDDMPVAPEGTAPCRVCLGEGRLADKTGGGHHKCKHCDGTGRVERVSMPHVVVVLYPGSDEPHVTEVGPFTRYSELVADYLTSIGEDFCLDGWQVIGEDDGLPRTLTMDIPADDYGKRLVVEMAS